MLQNSLTEVAEVQGKHLKSVFRIQKSFLSLIVAEKNFLLTEDPKAWDARDKMIADEDKTIRGEAEQILANTNSAEEKELINNLTKSYGDYYSVSEGVRKLAREGKLKDGIQMSQAQGREVGLKVEESTKALLARAEERMTEAQMSGATVYSRARMVMLLATLLSLGLGLFMAVWTMRAISKSIGQAIQALMENSNQLGSTAQSVAATSTQISQASTQQASVVQETASSIEEMNGMVSKNSESAQKASEVSAQSQKSAVHGKEVVEKMIHSIQEIDTSNTNIMDQIGQSNQQFTEIVRVISEIATKTQVINDVVFQTKLLSFNASVEAARAGEHGKGFAVVAEEVGNLAQMSGNAARDITAMLDGSIRKVESIVQETKSRVDSLVTENKGKVSEGVQVAKECGSVLDEIVGSVSGLTNMAASISSASQEQSQGVREITQAMNQLDQVTQQNAAASEQAANAASRLQEQANGLNRVISALTEAIYGGTAQARPITAPPTSEKATEKKVTTKKVAEKRGVDEPKVTVKPKAEVIPLPVKPKAQVAHVEDNTVKLKTAGVGSLASLPSPDDERFKDI